MHHTDEPPAELAAYGGPTAVSSVRSDEAVVGQAYIDLFGKIPDHVLERWAIMDDPRVGGYNSRIVIETLRTEFISNGPLELRIQQMVQLGQLLIQYDWGPACLHLEAARGLGATHSELYEVAEASYLMIAEYNRLPSNPAMNPTEDFVKKVYWSTLGEIPDDVQERWATIRAARGDIDAIKKLRSEISSDGPLELVQFGQLLVQRDEGSALLHAEAALGMGRTHPELFGVATTAYLTSGISSFSLGVKIVGKLLKAK